jgi:acyl CoA:acetate/3-ketoacid CoA transferase
VLERIGFSVQVRDDLQTMDPRLFRQGPVAMAADFRARRKP